MVGLIFWDRWIVYTPRGTPITFTHSTPSLGVNSALLSNNYKSLLHHTVAWADRSVSKADRGVTRADRAVTRADRGVARADRGVARADRSGADHGCAG